MNKEPKKILVVRTDRIGDVILSTPVIRNLKAAYPASHIAFMCRPYTKEALQGNPYCDEVIVYDKYGKHKNAISSIRFALALHRKKFDWALILHPTIRAHLVCFLAGIPQRVGFDRKMGFLLTKKIIHRKQEGKKHELHYTLDILRQLSIPIVDTETFFPLKKESEQFIRRLLAGSDINPDAPLIVVHPSASCPSKRWPQKHFSELIGLLKKEFSPSIALVASPKERGIGSSILKAHPDITDLRGQLNLSQLASLLKKSTLFISNDSGPVHIAAALGVPVISIFGRKQRGLSAVRWGPISSDSIILQKDAGCIECRAHNCTKGFLCLANLAPHEVFAAARKLLARQ